MAVAFAAQDPEDVLMNVLGQPTSARNRYWVLCRERVEVATLPENGVVHVPGSHIFFVPGIVEVFASPRGEQLEF
jgi:hypothetical protein